MLRVFDISQRTSTGASTKLLQSALLSTTVEYSVRSETQYRSYSYSVGTHHWVP